MVKVALVNQRYGIEVNGGSEYYTRLIAERLKDYYDVEILTTRAIDYVTWANYYPEGLQEVGGVSVRRFSVIKERDMNKFNQENGIILSNNNRTEDQESHWIDEQGPLSTDLVDYIGKNKDTYDVFIFVTYLYYNTAKGLPLVSNKSILIPTAHNEPYIYFKVFKQIFNIPKGIIFLTDEEKEFVHNRFQNTYITNDVMGVGVDVPEVVDALGFREKYKIKDEYIIYVGRIDLGKNCDWLFKYFIEYKKRQSNNQLKLVLMGKAVIDIPNHPDIISLGFVSEEDKFNGMAGSKALILPSEYESLSISVLEAMSLSVPVIVNGICEVLKGHCIKSNAGLYYKNYMEFEEAINYMLKYDGVYHQMKSNAKKYVDDYFQWDVIMKKFEKIILSICNK